MIKFVTLLSAFSSSRQCPNKTVIQLLEDVCRGKTGCQNRVASENPQLEEEKEQLRLDSPCEADD